MSEPILTLAEAIKVGLTVHEGRTSLKDLFYKTRNRIWKRTSNVLVFGPSGVGKSTFGRVISDTFVPEKHAQYRSSANREEYQIDLKTNTVLVVPPGQEDGRDFRWKELFSNLASGRSVGIVNVVAYGYHSFRDLQLSDLSVYEDGMTKEETMRAYTSLRREKKLDVLRYLKTRVQDAPGDIWMMTLIAKQDLWWDERNVVLNTYESGPYNQVIREIEEAKGLKSFTHTVSSGCFIIQNMRDKNDVVVASRPDEYDEVVKLGHLAHLRQRFDELIQ